jgi:hypothetical protein
MSSAELRYLLASNIFPCGNLTTYQSESIFKTERELQEEREIALKAKADRERQARERKERMKHLEHLATLKAKLSDSEVEKQAREQAIREAAASMMDQRSEVYKSLMSMSARAVAFTLREKQLEEKHHREEAEREYDRSMDIVMEIDRIKDIERREKEEIFKRTKRVEDRKVITEQMEQRQRVKLLAAELREQENNAMRALMKKYENEEVVQSSKRKVAIEKSRLEVVAANETAIRRKQDAKWLEKKEMEDILIYQALKDAELMKREDEERQLEHAKKERQALLLAQQERAQNNADKLDEIRARRAAEERERRAREKEREAGAKKRADLDELQRSRSAQAADKRAREEIAQQLRAEEYENALQHMAKMAAREADEKAFRGKMADEHRTNLSKQIDDVRRQRSE